MRPDVEVKKDPPKVDDLKDKDPSDKTMKGDDKGQRAPVNEPGPAPAKPVVVAEKPAPDKVFTFVEQKPLFPGGEAALFKYLGENIKYPSLARESGTEGKVFIQFVVNKDGSISDAKVVRGIGGGCDEEALRVVREMPKWEPGRQNGQSVRVQYSLPVVFKLE